MLARLLVSRQPHDPPFQADPFHADPFQADPFHADPFQADPFQADPFHAEPFHADPFHADPFHAEPFHAEPFQPSPLTEAGVPLKLGALSPVQLAAFQLDIDQGTERFTLDPAVIGSSGETCEAVLHAARAPRSRASR